MSAAIGLLLVLGLASVPIDPPRREPVRYSDGAALTAAELPRRRPILVSVVNNDTTRADRIVKIWPGTGRRRVLGKHIWNGVWSPDGRRVAYFRGDYYDLDYPLAVMRLDGSGKTILSRPNASSITPVRWVGSNRVLYAPRNKVGWQDFRIFNVDGRGPVVIYDEEQTVCPAVSPSRKRLAYIRFSESYEAHPQDLFVSALDGTEERLVVDGVNGDEVSWSPAGGLIAYKETAPQDDGPWSEADLHLVRPDGTGARQLTQTPDLHEVSWSWSPDGRWIAFVATGDGTGVGIYVVRVSDGEVRRLASTSGPGYGAPAWSRKSSRIAYVRERKLYTVRIAGGRPRFIAAPERGFFTNPSWYSEPSCS